MFKFKVFVILFLLFASIANAKYEETDTTTMPISKIFEGKKFKQLKSKDVSTEHKLNYSDKITTSFNLKNNSDHFKVEIVGYKLTVNKNDKIDKSSEIYVGGEKSKRNLYQIKSKFQNIPMYFLRWNGPAKKNELDNEFITFLWFHEDKLKYNSFHCNSISFIEIADYFGAVCNHLFKGQWVKDGKKTEHQFFRYSLYIFKPETGFEADNFYNGQKSMWKQHTNAANTGWDIKFNPEEESKMEEIQKTLPILFYP